MSIVKLTPAALVDLIARALEASRTSAINAASVARALTQAEIDGHEGHGLARVPSYAAQSKTGKIDGFAVPAARQTRPGALIIDVKHGFAYPAFDVAIARLPEIAGAMGLAAASFTRSHHFGVAGRHVERLAEIGLIGLVFSNTPSAMAAWGGKAALLGTNPIAFAAPRSGKPPIVVDLALSQVARGRLVAAAQRGDAIPPGCAVDQTGQPTTDAKAALAGTLLPAGGAKGAALAIMVEALAAALSGANFAYEASSFFDSTRGPPAVGQFLIALDPAAFAGRDVFLERFAALAKMIESDGARLPGGRRLMLREAAARDGLAVDAALVEEVNRLACG
jgi:(2R)-3-sulfolactate dehydrogenase (NADP+)